LKTWLNSEEKSGEWTTLGRDWIGPRTIAIGVSKKQYPLAHYKHTGIKSLNDTQPNENCLKVNQNFVAWPLFCFRLAR